MKCRQGPHALTPLLTHRTRLEQVCHKIPIMSNVQKLGTRENFFCLKICSYYNLPLANADTGSISDSCCEHRYTLVFDGTWWLSSFAWWYLLCTSFLLSCFSWLKAKAMTSFLCDSKLTSCHTSLLMDWGVFGPEVAFPSAATDVYNFY